MSQISTDVLVVGAGPVGLLTALLLEKVGIDYLVVERRRTLHTAPQAHVISSRSLEILRSIGISDEPIRAAGASPADTSNIRWVDALLGRDLGVFSLTEDVDAIQRMFASTPTPPANLSQDQFESLLFGHLPDKRRVRFQFALQDVESTGTGFICGLTDPDGQPVSVQCRYLIGADGAGSRVRKALGATMVGPDNIQTYVNIHFHADLRVRLKGREGLLYWVMENDCAGVFIAHDIDGNWVFMKSVGDDEPLDPIDEEKLTGMLRAAIGDDVAFSIQSMNAWRMTAQISDTYQSGRAFLVGDAAHRFPPTGGIGMNTGFQDAHNLVWKIAMVEQGGDAALLNTYEPERRPVAETNSAQSLANAMKLSEVSRLLDVDDDTRISRADLDSVLADPVRHAAVQAAIDRQSAHFNMSGLDLGFSYTSAAVVEDGVPPQSDNPVSHYLPSTTPGSRMPHAWLQSGGTRLSTLDLISYGVPLVLAAAPVDGLDAAVLQLRDAGYPLELAVVGGESELQPADGAFEELMGCDVVIVRPDGHVGARIAADAAVARLPHLVSVLFPRF